MARSHALELRRRKSPNGSIHVGALFLDRGSIAFEYLPIACKRLLLKFERLTIAFKLRFRKLDADISGINQLHLALAFARGFVRFAFRLCDRSRCGFLRCLFSSPG